MIKKLRWTIPLYVFSVISYLIIFLPLKYFLTPPNKEIQRICCILSDFLFYVNIIYFNLIILNVLKVDEISVIEPDKYYLVAISLAIIFLRSISIHFFSKTFSDYFGYNIIKKESNKIFYDIIVNDKTNKLSEIYSNYGPIINFIDYHRNKPNTFIDKLKNIFLDETYKNNSSSVKDYFEKHVSKPITEETLNKIHSLLNAKYFTSNVIWSILFITILFCLSVRNI